MWLITWASQEFSRRTLSAAGARSFPATSPRRPGPLSTKIPSNARPKRLVVVVRHYSLVLTSTRPWPVAPPAGLAATAPSRPIPVFAHHDAGRTHEPHFQVTHGACGRDLCCTAGMHSTTSRWPSSIGGSCWRATAERGATCWRTPVWRGSTRFPTCCAWPSPGERSGPACGVRAALPACSSRRGCKASPAEHRVCSWWRRRMETGSLLVSRHVSRLGGFEAPPAGGTARHRLPQAKRRENRRPESRLRCPRLDPV